MGGDRARYGQRQYDWRRGSEDHQHNDFRGAAAYLADEKTRLAAKTYGLYADVIELLQHSLLRQGGHYLQ